MTSREKHTQSTCSVTSSLKIKKGKQDHIAAVIKEGKIHFPQGTQFYEESWLLYWLKTAVYSDPGFDKDSSI